MDGVGFQLAAGQHFDFVGATFRNGVIPLRYCGSGNSESCGCFGRPTEVLNDITFFHSTPIRQTA